MNPGINARFTEFRDVRVLNEGEVMPTRQDICAIDRTAARPAAAFILGGLLLLICP
jgi:hypothetical protein